MSDKKQYTIDSNTYANIFTFMGFPLHRELDENVDAVVMGVPYDLATTGRSGTRYGPSGIRQASSILRWEERRWPWDFNLLDRLKVIDYGDIVFDDGDSESMLSEVTEEAGKIISAGKTLLSLGGDHYVTLPLIRAAAKKYGKLALVHFDAHTDTETGHDGHYHGSMFHLANEEGIIDPDSTIQIGIRTDYNKENHPFKVIDGVLAENYTASEIAQQIMQTVGDRPTYLSFDIDCLDPAFAPGTGTPVTGGISTNKALQILRKLTQLNIIAMDLVEVAPAYDHAEITSLAGATIALDLLYLIAASK